MAAADAKAAEAELIAFAATFPGAWEDHPWDHTVMKVGKKVFVFFGGAASPPGEISLTVKLPVSYEMALTLPYMSPAGHGLWKGGWAALRQHDGDDESHALDLQVVAGVDRVDDLGPDPVQAEEVLDHEGAGYEGPDVEACRGEHRAVGAAANGPARRS